MNSHRSCVLGLTLLMASACHAQSGTLTITHDDPDGLIDPGQVVHMEVRFQWQDAFLFWEIQGNLLASPNSGIASNNRFGNPNAHIGPGTIIQPGTVQGGSVVGVRIVSGELGHLAGWPPDPAWWAPGGVPVLKVDWTAPTTPGTVDFAWQPSAALPMPLMFVTPTTFNQTPIPTTYLGTSLTVIPAPSTLLARFGAGVVASGRRRGSVRP